MWFIMNPWVGWIHGRGMEMRRNSQMNLYLALRRNIMCLRCTNVLLGHAVTSNLIQRPWHDYGSSFPMSRSIAGCRWWLWCYSGRTKRTVCSALGPLCWLTLFRFLLSVTGSGICMCMNCTVWGYGLLLLSMYLSKCVWCFFLFYWFSILSWRKNFDG